MALALLLKVFAPLAPKVVVSGSLGKYQIFTKIYTKANLVAMTISNIHIEWASLNFDKKIRRYLFIISMEFEMQLSVST